MTSERSRPYWHVDLKWVFGLLALIALSAALLLFNLSNLTERERSIKLSATIVASLFSREGLDDGKGLVEFRQKAQVTPGNTITPIPQFPWLTITKQEALTLEPADLRIAIFSQLTTPIYDKGLRGAAAQMTQNPDEQAQFMRDASLLGVFTKSTHDTLKQLFYISAVISLLLLGGAVYFSAGIGCFVTPGVLLIATSLVGTIAGLLFLYSPRDGDGPISALPTSVSTEIGNSLSQSYGTVSCLGILLLLVAVTFRIVRKIRNKS